MFKTTISLTIKTCGVNPFRLDGFTAPKSSPEWSNTNWSLFKSLTTQEIDLRDIAQFKEFLTSLRFGPGFETKITESQIEQYIGGCMSEAVSRLIENESIFSVKPSNSDFEEQFNSYSFYDEIEATLNLHTRIIHEQMEYPWIALHVDLRDGDYIRTPIGVLKDSHRIYISNTSGARAKMIYDVAESWQLKDSAHKNIDMQQMLFSILFSEIKDDTQIFNY